MKDVDKKLDDVFAVFIKLKYTNDEGFGKCYTCDEPLNYNEMDCGHYPNISRKHTQFRWNTEIHKPQCIQCNRFEDGMPGAFRDHLIDELGSVKLAKMEFDSHKSYNGWTNHAKKELLKELRSKCRIMAKEKMFPVNIP